MNDAPYVSASLCGFKRIGKRYRSACLWDEWHDKASGETLTSCTMIITEPVDVSVALQMVLSMEGVECCVR